ncbi:MAG: tRNA 2-selenouridine(34) synthase MnmH, partial [Pseudohongiellaceae bacterium]
FTALLQAGTPLLDVRAPVEFSRGAIPCAVNIPLLDDEQRRRIGIRYREAGQDAAISLGHELISGAEKEQRLAEWQRFHADNPGARLYCFRGGLRSRIVQEWLDERGIAIPRIAGGYKALRGYLLGVLEKAAARDNLIVVAGKTGCAKTHLLRQLPAHVDLEGHANHRGSAFGPRHGGQPAQIDFENALAVDFIRLAQTQPQRIFVEDESRAIGSLSVPVPLFEAMRESPLAVIEETLENRAETILRDYIIANFDDMRAAEPTAAAERFAGYLTGSLDKIRRRLGLERHGEIRALMEAALERQLRDGSTSQHRTWIEKLLTDYYDPMYEYQLNKKLSRIVFRGNRREFLDWADTMNNDSRHH